MAINTNSGACFWKSPVIATLPLTDTPGYSAAGWFWYGTAHNAFQAVITKGDATNTNRPMWCGIQAATGLPGNVGVQNGFVVMTNTSATTPFIYTNSATTTGVWNFFCFSHQGTGASSNNLWVAPIGGTWLGTTQAGTGGAATDSNCLFSVGAEAGGGSTYQEGIGWTAVWRGALNAAEAQALFSGANPVMVRPQNLLVYYDARVNQSPFVNRGVLGQISLATAVTSASNQADPPTMNPLRNNSIGASGAVTQYMPSMSATMGGAKPFLKPFLGPQTSFISAFTRWAPFQLKAY